MEKKYRMENRDVFDIKDNFILTNQYPSNCLWSNNKTYLSTLSIVIPVYMRTEYIQDCLKSALGQKTDFLYEVIIVNDAGDDDNVMIDILNENKTSNISIKYYRNSKRLGLVGNFNRCIEVATSEYILILHDDDVLDEYYVEQMTSKLCNHHVDALGCLHKNIDYAGNMINSYPNSTEKIRRIGIFDFYLGHPVSIVGLIARRKVLLDLGGFDEHWGASCDLALLVNIAHKYNLYLYNSYLFYYRVAANESMKSENLLNEIIVPFVIKGQIFKKYNFIPEVLHNIHLSISLLDYEKAAASNWGSNDGFCSLNDSLSVKKYGRITLLIYRIIMKFVVKINNHL